MRFDFNRVDTQQIVCPSRHLHDSRAPTHKESASKQKKRATQGSTAIPKISSNSSGTKKKTRSPEEDLLRKVNSLAGERNAQEAVRVIKCALSGVWPPPPQEQGGTSKAEDNTLSSSSTRRRAIFSSKAFAAALYACEAAGSAADGLSLVAEARRHVSDTSADGLNSEHVLFAILRLQCATGDLDGAKHLFAYLEQHGLLRLRSVSVFLRYCCLKVKDRRLAFAVYEKALQHKVELTEPDYVALGTLCVQIDEPISTLFFMLEEMKEHVPEVSVSFVADVLESWVAMANRAEGKGEGNSGTPTQRYHISTVMMEHREPTPLGNASDASLGGTDVCLKDGSGNEGSNVTTSDQQRIQACGVCPACRVELAGYAFTTACRTHLLRELKDIVIPQACRSRRALLGFEHWKRYIHARYESGDRVGVFIDGANLGYYGLSSWYDLAKKQLLLQRGVPEGQVTASDVDFNKQCKASGKGVDVGVSFDLIDSAVKLAVEEYGLERPLVMLHERHVEPRFMTPQATSIVQRWRSLGWLYCCPSGLNDDLCWLYGALLMTDPTDANCKAVHQDGGQQPAVPSLLASHRTFVCTNDKMRDHHFRLLSPRAFARWRDRHRIGFRCARVEDQTELHWELPAPYERCIQRHDAVLRTPQNPSTFVSPRGDGGEREMRTVPLSTWHIPLTGSPAASSATSFTSSRKAAAGTKRYLGNELDGEQPKPGLLAESLNDCDRTAEQADEGSAEPQAPVDTQKPSPWVCITVNT
ncbi:hypothetical protein ABL78_1371 [Leptomonas seymouri]|uniref:PROP1-like PPR domain-containing protein n=1 Tax=Leptomonas seymouri TaxID=5684 RepID=A0A0N1IM55_LEPSE|nr:hypothetical protein ABL78_1371 [Leptomonas seymouri]|eukprot:KPI89495.1 hypothetical protein ABL78_1371 [Leptomonas seymouri]